jgi:hypothetical protein
MCDHRWCARLSGTLEDLDDDHATAAAGAQRTRIRWRCWFSYLGRLWCEVQLARTCDIGPSATAGEEAVVTYAVEAVRQNVEQEAADEPVGAERHDAPALGTDAAIVLVAEGDTGVVESDQPSVRSGDAMGVAHEIGKHRLRPEKGGLEYPPIASCGAAPGDGGRRAGHASRGGQRRTGAVL